MSSEGTHTRDKQGREFAVSVGFRDADDGCSRASTPEEIGDWIADLRERMAPDDMMRLGVYIRVVCGLPEEVRSDLVDPVALVPFDMPVASPEVMIGMMALECAFKVLGYEMPRTPLQWGRAVELASSWGFAEEVGAARHGQDDTEPMPPCGEDTPNV